MATKAKTAQDIKDEAEYSVEVLRPIDLFGDRGVILSPSHTHKVRGSLLKQLQADPKHEGAIGAITEVTE